MGQNYRAVFFVVCLIAVNILFAIRRIYETSELREHTYTYDGVDFPPQLPGEVGTISMVFQESQAYPLLRPYSDNDPGSYNGLHVGVVRLGPTGRSFVIAMFHQLHCIQFLRHAFKIHQSDHWTKAEHMQHCLRMLRQQFLCASDLTLEDYDFMTANFTSIEDRYHKPRTCRDWESLHTRVEENYIDWRRTMLAKGTPVVEETWLAENRRLVEASEFV